jgi:hypothetical protein
MNRGMGIWIFLIVLMNLFFLNKEIFPKKQSEVVIPENRFILIIDFHLCHPRDGRK